MIEALQRTKLATQMILAELRAGRLPDIPQIAEQVSEYLRTRPPFGQPHTKLRPAITGMPISASHGRDLQDTFEELRGDLDTLYLSLFTLTRKSTDLYDSFAVRRDQLAQRQNQLRLEMSTMLAQNGAGSEHSFYDSFNNLEQLDLEATTAHLDLQEGLATLPADARTSVKHDGTKVKLFRSLVTGVNAGDRMEEFLRVFSPYRADSWYVTLDSSSVVEVIVNVTGADYENGAVEEVVLNGLRIEAASPLLLRVDWSPDGFNFTPLEPTINQVVQDIRSFFFESISVGYLRFRIQRAPSSTSSNNGSAGPVGIKRIELFRRGWARSATLVSTPYSSPFPISTVSVQLDREVPFGTKLDFFVSQDGDTWIPVGASPLRLEGVQGKELPLSNFIRESATSRFWYVDIPDYPLPETGELVAGSEQVYIQAYPFHRDQSQDREALLSAADFEAPLGVLRGDAFQPRGTLDGADGIASGFVEDRNPLAVTTDIDGNKFLVLTIVQSDGEFSLQPGYNYQVRAHLYCNNPRTLENQRCGVFNPSSEGGTAGVAIAPLTLFINGEKVYEKAKAVNDFDSFLGPSCQYNLPLQQGWNTFDLFFHLPGDLVAGQAGLASRDVYLYLQPNFFDPEREDEQGVSELRAYLKPWPKVSEFDLRYSTPISQRSQWAWKLDSAGQVESLLLNHEPQNLDQDEAGDNRPYQTIDGVNKGGVESLQLNYSVERSVGNERTLYARADFSQSDGGQRAPLLRSYTILVN